MKRDIAECLQMFSVPIGKCWNKKPVGKLQDLPIPEWKWEHTTIDFVSGLSRTQRECDTIWVIVDCLTKSAHFLLIKKNYSLIQLAKLYVKGIIRYHGVLVSIISDRDPRFTSR